MQSLGEIEQRAPAVGAKMWCLSLCFFVRQAPSPERRAFEGCIVRTSIALPFIGRFGLLDFSAFFPQVIALSAALHNSYICC